MSASVSPRPISACCSGRCSSGFPFPRSGCSVTGCPAAADGDALRHRRAGTAPLAWRQSDGRPAGEPCCSMRPWGLPGGLLRHHVLGGAPGQCIRPWRPCSSACRCWRAASAGLGVEQRAGRLLAILALGASGALGWPGPKWRRLLRDAAGLRRAGFLLRLRRLGALSGAQQMGLANGSLPTQAGLRTFWSLVAGAVLIGLMGRYGSACGAAAHESAGPVAGDLPGRVLQRDDLLPAAARHQRTDPGGNGLQLPVPFVSMLLLFFDQPARMGWHWLPGSLLVILAIGLLLRRTGSQAAEAVRPSSSARVRAIA